MGIPLMIQNTDNERIENLKKDFGIHKKIDVIRAGLDLLEKEAERLKRIKRWKQAAKLVADSSQKINKEFQKHSRLKSNE
jgi:ATP-dependent Lon protease